MKININNLLEKYWNAEASLQEEAELRAYFSGSDVAPEHEQFRDLFSYFSVSRLQSTDLDVEEVLSSLSDIDAILVKYWNAETSVEEERQLSEYFAGDSIAPEHEQFKDLFGYYDVLKAQTSSLDLNELFEKHKTQDTDIDGLLEKYWNAESSLEEETVLREYFSGGKVAQRHEAYRGMFGLFASKASETCDLDVEKILSEAEAEIGERAIGSHVMPRASKAKVFSLQRWAAGIAAVFVLGFAAITVMDQAEPTTQYKGHATVLDDEAEAQEAYEITKEALAFLSKNMNKGSKTVVSSVSKAEKVKIFK